MNVKPERKQARLPAIRVPQDALDDFAAAARFHRLTTSAAIRQALEAWAREHGAEIDFSVQPHGGYRGRKEDTDHA